MKIMSNLKATLLAGAMIVGTMSAASADYQAITLPLPSQFEYTNGPWTLGFEFSPTQNINVTALGDYFPAGSTTQQGASLWDASGNLLATTQVTGPAAAQGQFSFAAITPLTLLAGQDYVVGGTTQTDNYIVTFGGRRALSVPTSTTSDT